MKVLLVNGSPHEQGCTNRALEELQAQFAREDAEAEIFWLGKSMQPCIACNRCAGLGRCVFDDRVNVFARLAETADGFVFGTPVYYSGAIVALVYFMNRLFYAHGRKLMYKTAATVVSCRRGGATMAFAELNQHYLMLNMLVVGSQYWNQVHGAVPEDVEQDLEGLQTMRTLARNMAWTLRCLEAGRRAGVETPRPEPITPTNFIR